MLAYGLFHFDFWPSLFASILYSIYNAVLLAVVYEIPVDGSYIQNSLFHLTYNALSAFGIFIIVRKIGQLHVSAEIRKGSEQVLNDLDQGVVILSKDSKNVLFANEAAKKLPININ